MLRQNSDLRPHRIWNWTIPAWYITLEDGKRFSTCPNAGVCAQYCYARNGTYLFKNVLAAHTKNLMAILDDPQQWQIDMMAELEKRRYRPTGTSRTLPIPLTDIDTDLHRWVLDGGAAVRIHDSGDFFADWYLELWCDLADWFPDVLFYAYTKEVEMVKNRAEPFPFNLRILFSTGGLQDHMIDPDTDRHADVFPDQQSLSDAGYESQDANDLLAVLLPTNKIGIPANNIRHFNKRLAGRRFSEAVPERLRMKGLS